MRARNKKRRVALSFRAGKKRKVRSLIGFFGSALLELTVNLVKRNLYFLLFCITRRSSIV